MLSTAATSSLFEQSLISATEKETMKVTLGQLGPVGIAYKPVLILFHVYRTPVIILLPWAQVWNFPD